LDCGIYRVRLSSEPKRLRRESYGTIVFQRNQQIGFLTVSHHYLREPRADEHTNPTRQRGDRLGTPARRLEPPPSLARRVIIRWNFAGQKVEKQFGEKSRKVAKNQPPRWSLFLL